MTELQTQIAATIFDPHHPRSVLNICPAEMKVAIERLGGAWSHWFTLSEAKFRKKCDPDPITSRLRLSFWDEYDRAQDNNDDMKVSNIVRGVCTVDYFYRYICQQDKKVAWIINQPADYAIATREMHELGLTEMRKILKCKNFVYKQEKTGKKVFDEETNKLKDEYIAVKQYDKTLMSLKVKIWQILDLRVKGAIVQRQQIDMTSKSLHVSADAAQMLNAIEDMHPDELLRLSKNLDKLQAEAPEAGISLTPGTIIDGRVTDAPKSEVIIDED